MTKPEANPITSHSGHSRDDIFISPQLIGIQDFSVFCVREAHVLKVKKKNASVKQHDFFNSMFSSDIFFLCLMYNLLFVMVENILILVMAGH